MEKTDTHTYAGENCDFACLFIGLRHLRPRPLNTSRSLPFLLHFHAGRRRRCRLAVDVSANATGCECGKKKKKNKIKTHM